MSASDQETPEQRKARLAILRRAKDAAATGDGILAFKYLVLIIYNKF